MISNTRRLSLGAITTTLSLALIIDVACFSPTAKAQDGNSNKRSETIELNINNDTKRNSSVDEQLDRSTKGSAKRDRNNVAKEKLSATKLQACFDRKAKIDQRIINISQRVEKHVAVFDSVAQRIQEFYTANGGTLVDYEMLAADVTVKKATAQAAVDALKSQTISIDCEGIEPKSVITTYKASLKTTIIILREYRTSIKDLIIAVKSTTRTTTHEDMQ